MARQKSTKVDVAEMVGQFAKYSAGLELEVQKERQAREARESAILDLIDGLGRGGGLRTMNKIRKFVKERFV